MTITAQSLTAEPWQTQSRLPLVLCQTLAQLRRRLQFEFGQDLLQLRLFGSYARGEADADSDVDVCVVLSELDWDKKRAVLHFAADLSLASGLWISPTVLGAAECARWREQQRPLLRDIDEEGISF